MLPKDDRGIHIPVHVRRNGGKARFTDVDIMRLMLIACEKRCTICGWQFQPDERFWYIGWEPELERMRKLNWTPWQTADEGVAHEECILYSAAVCPYLNTPDYARRTDHRRADGSVVTPKGTIRPKPVPAGMPVVMVQTGNPQTPFQLAAGGGEPDLRPFDNPEQLNAMLSDAIASADRQPDRADVEFATFMAERTKHEISVRAMQAFVVMTASQGEPLPKLGRNAPCTCGSGTKAKHCCIPRHNNAFVPDRR